MLISNEIGFLFVIIFYNKQLNKIYVFSIIIVVKDMNDLLNNLLLADTEIDVQLGLLILTILVIIVAIIILTIIKKASK